MAFLFRKSYGPYLKTKKTNIYYTSPQYNTNKAQDNPEKQRQKDREKMLLCGKTEKYELTISCKIYTYVFRRNTLVSH